MTTSATISERDQAIYHSDINVTMYQTDARSIPLPDGSVHCCVTSPPYWGLRDYGIEGQLGAEDTPEEYVSNMVDVFREVRRVLRDDGTLWLNLGNSYAAGGGTGVQRLDELGKKMGTGGGHKHSSQECHRAPTPVGLKPKDLVGIPWLVAKALQAPYYTGRIKREADRAWLAAIIDGEGCIFIHKRKAGQSNGQGYERKNATFSAGLEVSNTSRAIVDRCMALVGMGSICEQTPEQNPKRRQTIYRWSVRSNECKQVLLEVYPHLVAKQHEARLALGCPSSGDKASTAHESLKSLHNGQKSAIDFAEPASMFEPGWYLRSDIIWAKPNPMPESVTDRPTKSHEHIFLLSKSARYHYDAEAIKDPVSAAVRGSVDSRGRRNKRDVWTVATQPYSGAHFAAFPPKLIEPCILAGCPKFGTVLDPFFGSGTTGWVARKHGRKAVGCDLKAECLDMAKKRLSQTVIPFL